MKQSPRRRYLTFPPALPVLSRWESIVYFGRSLLEFPFYWLAAIVLRAPGMAFRWRCFCAGVRLLAARGSGADAYRCVVAPMDSVRHFEMDFFWRRAKGVEHGNVLDVSSPRLFTLMLLMSRPQLVADFLNPDGKDLQRTADLANALGVSDRCRFIPHRIDSLEGQKEGHALVVCMSVLEHIVNDADALHDMWARVAPGGRLLLSVPCAAVPVEEYTNVDEYGLLEKDNKGFVFWQRYYDEAGLMKLFEITGVPASMEIYGERTPGAYDADIREKRTNHMFPRWREPYATVRTYVHVKKLSSLRGMGVTAMEFVKPAASTSPDPDERSK